MDIHSPKFRRALALISFGLLIVLALLKLWKPTHTGNERGADAPEQRRETDRRT